MTTQTVTIEVRPVGQSFGCAAVLRDAQTGRKLATGSLRPFGFNAAARADGERIAAEKNWIVVERRLGST